MMILNHQYYDITSRLPSSPWEIRPAYDTGEFGIEVVVRVVVQSCIGVIGVTELSMIVRWSWSRCRQCGWARILFICRTLISFVPSFTTLRSLSVNWDNVSKDRIVASSSLHHSQSGCDDSVGSVPHTSSALDLSNLRYSMYPVGTVETGMNHVQIESSMAISSRPHRLE